MKIFCIGLSRTGTTTLCHVLDELGFSVTHYPIQLYAYPECIDSNLHFQTRNNLLSFQKRRLEKQVLHLRMRTQHELFDEFDAFGDLPIPLYYKKLDKKFPNSKFIYTYRDEEKWLKSIQWNVSEGVVHWGAGFVEEELIAHAYGDRKFDREKYLAAYRAHHKDVIEYFSGSVGLDYPADKKHKFLSIDLDKGEMNFERICKFLELPVREGTIRKSNVPKKASVAEWTTYQIKRNIPFVLEGYHYFMGINRNAG